MENFKQMPSYDIEDQRSIVVANCVLHNFIRIHDREDEGFKWDELENNDDEGSDSSNQENMENIHHEEMKVICNNIAQSICGL
jgi:hypothetical protein